MYVTFISHATPDDQLAESLSEWFQSEGFGEPFVDQKSITGGQKWKQALKDAAGACRLVICIVTPRWLEREEWCLNEWRTAWMMGKAIIPLFLLDDESTLGPAARDALNEVRAEDQGLDFNAVLGADGRFNFIGHPEKVDALRRALRFVGVQEKVGPDPEEFLIDRSLRESPFPGLAGFEDNDADAAIFFGRGRAIAEVLEDLRAMRAAHERRPLVILGASGSGKSSLLKAGIIPRLRRETRTWLPLRAFRPGADPLLNFAKAWTQTLSLYGDTEASGSLRNELRQVWRDAHQKQERLESTKGQGQLTINEWGQLQDTLGKLIERLRTVAARPHATVLISVDQAEEMARSQGESGDAMADYLRAALFTGSVQLALTIRTDSFPELQRHPRFQGLEARGYDLRPLPVYRFDQVVEAPARRYGVQVQPELVDKLMEDSPEQDALPLLAFGLQQLWDQFAAKGRLKEADYLSTGGLHCMLEDAAERALHGVSIDDVRPPRSARPTLDELGARVFVPALVDLNEQGEPIRRVAEWSKFDEEGQALLTRFDQSWRLVVRKTSVEGTETVEVAHEALLRVWSRFGEWLEPERGRLEALRALIFQAATWDRRGQKSYDLSHRGKRLTEAGKLLVYERFRPHLGDREHAYLDASLTQERWRNRRWVSAVASVLLLVTGFIGAWWQRDVLDKAAFEYFTIRSFIHQDVRPYVRWDLGSTTQPQLTTTSTFSECRVHCPEMVVVPPGAFMMGDESEQYGFLLPIHPVSISQAFAVSTTEVTFDQWELCVRYRGCSSVADSGFGRGKRPVINVTWQDAQDYVHWLSRMTGRPYRLLTEAEWEYVARATSTTAYTWGSAVGQARANCDGCGSKWDDKSTAPVRSFEANAFGLYDVHGNVWEWVEDCWNDSYDGAPSDGSVWNEGDCSKAVVRGGSWDFDPVFVRSAIRLRDSRGDQDDNLGFRVARTLSVPKAESN